MKIATWNINSVRLRIAQVARLVAAAKPDVLCLQEIKCRDGEFPSKAFADMGLKHLHIVGQKGWHGVAIASRHKLEPLPSPPLCPKGEARTAAALVKGVEVHCLYVPAGGDTPDAAANEKFAHKLQVVDAMERHYAALSGRTDLVVVGDLNIAPGEHDVWSHKQLLDVVSHTPIETEGLERARTAGGLVDIVRAARPAPEKVFTWWSYRNQDWRASNRGRRLDHIWASAALAPKARDVTILDETRDWPQPSDHVPALVRFRL
jgi:exodeoxyribonuclease-3